MSRTLVTGRGFSPANHHVAPVSIFRTLHHLDKRRLTLFQQDLAGPKACLHTSAAHAISWKEFALSVRSFGGGVKALYRDMQLMRDCMYRHGSLKIKKSAPSSTGDGKTTLLYSRKELQFMYRVRIVCPSKDSGSFSMLVV